MRKHMIRLLLVCMILTSLTSGTMAIYTTKLEFEDAVTVTAKRFYIGVNSVGSFDVMLAPGEESRNEFTVTNVDEKGMCTEVDMSLTIEGDFTELYSEIPGIQVALVEVGNPDLRQPVGDDGLLKYFEKTAFQADQSGTRTFQLVFHWDATAQDQAQFAGKHVSGITLYVTGTQSV